MSGMDKKPYVVLARKYRPQTFDELVGQEAVATTLKNAIQTGRVGHAYLFTGPRGVGKTSTARIFAKALNCEKGPTVKPCGKCRACAEIEQVRSLDVLEIDGASNRGIDEIRALRENVKFAPAAGKYKVYIIDEVHQITIDGFNALLKTLEEPPAHVKFIFATTAANKVPATILSRCQRFDFRRIPSERIAALLKDICAKEGIDIEPEALGAIARAADGGLRDSQSILDQIAASTDGRIRREHVVRSLGVLEEERLVSMLDALVQRDAKSALVQLNDVLEDGKDAALFVEKLLEHLRNVLFAQISEELVTLADAGESYRAELLRQRQLLTREELFYCFAVIAQAAQLLRRYELKRIPIEMALVKIAHRVPMEELSELVRTLRDAESRLPQAGPQSLGAAAVPAAPVVSAPTPAAPPPRLRRAAREDEDSPDDAELPPDGVELARAPQPAPQAAAVQAPQGEVALEAVWPRALSALKKEKILVYSYLMEGTPVSYAAGVVRIAFQEKHTFNKESLETIDNKAVAERVFSELLGQPVRIEYLVARSGQALPESPAAADASDAGVIRSAMQIFGGKVIED
ncbi:MAG: Holliday junction ATP-dependent DNA helicase RuvB [Candidatus Omnitrophica bacterium]|nr:Holliday junction ATP-dependent DNA helicase RuvB [Candidatus Omnitrophota bacterium]